MTKTFKIILAAVVGVLILAVAYFSLRSSRPTPSDLQRAASSAASAIVVKSGADSALAHHVQDSVERAAVSVHQQATATRSAQLDVSRRHIEAEIPDVPDSMSNDPPDTTPDPELSAWQHTALLQKYALDTANAEIGSLHTQVQQLEQDTTSLAGDNHDLVASLDRANRRLTQDTVVTLPTPQHPHFLGIRLPSLRGLLPSLNVSKDLVRYDPSTGKFAAPSATSLSVGLGYHITL